MMQEGGIVKTAHPGAAADLSKGLFDFIGNFRYNKGKVDCRRERLDYACAARERGAFFCASGDPL